ncbi:kinesin-like protein kin-10a, partial [Quercus suber]
LHYNNANKLNPSSNPNTLAKETPSPQEHPVEDFSLDGVSLSKDQDLDLFYKTFVESRIHSVKLQEKCTIMMYSPTGSSKSHTMFKCSKPPGIVYKSLRDILGGGEEES